MAENNTLSTDIYAFVNLTYYAIGCVILTTIGFIGNGLIVLAVATNSDMREKSNFMVASLALADFCSCLGILLTAISTFVGYDKNISQRDCFLIQSLAIFWTNVDNLLIFLIGIDRLLILRHAVRYAHASTRKYVTAFVISALGYGLLMIVLAADSVTDVDVSLCIVTYAFNGFAKDFWLMLNGLVCIGVLIVYFIAGRLARKKKTERTAASSISREYRRLLTSLTIVAAIYAFATMSPILYLIVFKLIIPLDPLKFQQYAVYSSWTILIQIACAPFIYYNRSHEYRIAVRKTICGKESVESGDLWVANNATSVSVRVRLPPLTAAAAPVRITVTDEYDICIPL